MSKATIKGFFNPRHAGDTFKGLNSTIDGTVADKPIGNLFAFLKAAGRDYFIKRVPAGVLDPEGAIDSNGQAVPAWIEVPGQYHLARSSDNRVISPHTVTDSYAPLSLMDMAEELQPWCDAGWTTPDGVYSARNESLELLSLRLDAGGDLPDGEKFLHYMVFQNPHATGGKPKGKIISWRIVCANTFARAIASTADWTITHRIGIDTPEKQAEIMAERRKEAVEAWDNARKHIDALAERIQTLKGIPLSIGEAESMTDRLLGIGTKEKDSKRAENKKEAILRAFNMPQFGTFGKDAWDWNNAVTFTNSSEHAENNRKSKVSALDRLVRNVDPNATGYRFEEKANGLLAELIG